MRVRTVVVMLGVLLAADARAQTKRECNDAYEAGQRLRRQGRLIEARKDFVLCARDPCPTAFQPECVEWLREVEHLLPSVLLDVSGACADNARVLVDGAPTTLDGRELPIDPGDHVFRVEAAGCDPLERHELIVEGVRARTLAFTLARAQATHAEGVLAPSRSLPWAALALTGVAVAGAITWMVAGVHGLDEYKRCNTGCPQSEIDDLDRRWLVTDFAIPITIVTSAIATYFWIRWATTSPAVSRGIALSF
jgi:hypothetical protein